MMHPILNELGWSFAILPRPRGGEWLEDDVHAWRCAGIGLVASLLTDEEVAELDLHREPDVCAANGIRWFRHPIDDRGVPCSRADFDAFVADLAAALESGIGVGVHCRMGIGRSALTAACVLFRGGVPHAGIWTVLERSRGCEVPDTPEQIRWVEAWSRSCRP
jgi:protein-tyrosine phosphatase